MPFIKESISEYNQIDYMTYEDLVDIARDCHQHGIFDVILYTNGLDIEGIEYNRDGSCITIEHVTIYIM